MKKYALYNNILGWLCFLVATVTYLLTIEPTISFWDCPEFIIQGDNLQVGHPPGNPIFMLAARFFVNFAFGDVDKVAIMVNSMSALLSAGTILFLFWTITYLVKRLVVADDATSLSLWQMLVIFGSGVCGSLAYTWSDTFWFSAVEGEVYAFSSFCTALVFWLILKWDTCAEHPHSDKYLVLIAYIIGVSIAVHLLNLLTIPALGLVFYYRKSPNATAKGSLAVLCVSAAIVGAILYGLVPGFIEIAQYFELFFVNSLGMSYNTGVLIYAVLLVASFVWALRALYQSRSIGAVRLSVLVSVVLSGILFIGDSLWIPVVLTVALAIYLWCARQLPVRVLNIVIVSIMVIFAGYSSYALLLIRSSANTPMNQNAPDNVFALAGYLNREQYGERPLFYGQTYNASAVYHYDHTSGGLTPLDKGGKREYSKVQKTSPGQKDHYQLTGTKPNYVTTPELNMLFPRIYDGKYAAAYKEWTGMNPIPVEGTVIVDEDGNAIQTTAKYKPSFADNIRFFLVYQLNHMYWRYFLWNFAGRQNDIQGQGEVNHGNWISGIPLIDNPRLGNQSLLPYEEGAGNKGHNVFYMLPLLLGIIGLCWQAFCSKRGIEQFWVVFFLFFMTGIAIVIYLNQTPLQVRERDYAFAGSFYAYSIWIGMGVAGLACFVNELLARNKKRSEGEAAPHSLAGAVAACVIGLAVPLQMVSQTWDDHDRSGRYAARDFGRNYLYSVDPNAILFCNGDNDTFPLWYAQEVDHVRTDVKVVNQSYLTTDWYANLMRYPTYEADGIEMMARPENYAYNALQFTYFDESTDSTVVNALASLKQVYSPQAQLNSWGVPMMKYPKVYIPVDIEKAIADGHLTEAEALLAEPAIYTNLQANAPQKDGLTLGNVLTLDILATSMANGWNRPVYFAMTVPDEYYLGLNPYMRATGMAYEITPVYNPTTDDSVRPSTDRSYENITQRFLWGGLDVAEPGSLYLDETVRRMVTTVRTAVLTTAEELINEGYEAKEHADAADDPEHAAEALEYADDRFNKARHLLQLMEEKLPEKSSPYSVLMPQRIAIAYEDMGRATGNEDDSHKALEVITAEIMRTGDYVRYYQSLTPLQYNSLQNTDRYVDQNYMLTLLQLFQDMGGDIEQVATDLQDMGVDLTRQFARLSKQQS